MDSSPAHAAGGSAKGLVAPSRLKPWKTWRKTNSGGNIPGPRSGAASVVVGDKLFMFGGYGGNGRLDDFFEYQFETKKWREVEYTGSSPGVRENNGVVEYKGCLYLFGGYNGSQWLNDFHEFNLTTQSWRTIEPADGFCPASRFGYVSVVHANHFVLFGGYDGTTWLNDMHQFDFDTMAWSVVHASGTVPSIRSCPSWCMSSFSSSVFVFGGYDGVQRMNDFFECRLDTYTWSVVTATGYVPSPRYFHACAMYANCMYVFGGYNGTERLNDMYEYSFDTLRWTTIETQGELPSGRSSLVAQVYGNSLFVFGGYNGQVVLNDFYESRYEPVAFPPPPLIHDMRTLIDNKDFSDVTFIVEGRPLYASRAHLAVRSEHFRAMLYGGMRESSGVEISIPDVGYEVFTKVLEYLYTDSVVDIPSELAVPLLIAAEQYLLDRLKVRLT
jgi:N-acetylneuraminic acid mutarotase